MIGIITFLTIITLTLLTTRIAAVALSLTGMSDVSAKFQARSALSGAGFTTSESEVIMKDPRRRKIIMKLMLIGHVGFVAIMATGVLSFMHIKNDKGWTSVIVFLAGLGFLLFLTLSKATDKYLRKIIQKFFKEHTNLIEHDYDNLLCLNGNFILAEIPVQKNDWLENKTLADAKLDEEGILVLGIRKTSGDYIGIPQGNTVFQAGDSITLYGHSEQIGEINKRAAGHKGETSHKDGIKTNEEMVANAPE
ncbi:MAG: potassium transporter TrkA [Chlamydiae bacterium]|nr:MAG: potassium transporter TrkA [Chlamydiota bacterium]